MSATTRGGGRRRPPPRARWSRGPTASRTCATTSPTRSAPGILRPDELPEEIADVVGRSQSRQIGAFVGAVFDAIDRTGHVGMTEPAAGALARFRAFNFDRIYLRPAARQQAEKVVGLLRGLVDFFVDAPTRMPADATDMHAGLVPGLAGDGRGRRALRERDDRSLRARTRCRAARLALRAPAARRVNRRATPDRAVACRGMGILDEDVQRVREATDLVALAGEHLALKRVGRSVTASARSTPRSRRRSPSAPRSRCSIAWPARRVC